MSKKWWVLISVACGTFMATLDSSIVNIALPTLTTELHSELSHTKWVVIVYFFAITCLLLPFGRISDVYGRRRALHTGFFVFTLGSALCALSSTLGSLIGARFIQAIGASILMANGPAVITAAFPATQRGRALGTMAMVVSAGLIMGPGLGGFLVSEFGWQSIFWVNVPVGILALLLASRFIPKDHLPKTRPPFDWAGAFLQLLILAHFMVLFDPPKIAVLGGEPAPMPRWILAALMVVLGVIFARVESQATAPIFDGSLLKSRTFWTANLASFLSFVSFSSISVLMPFFLEQQLHLEPRHAGVFMMAIPVMILFVAPISGRISDSKGSRELSFAGTLVSAATLFFMSGVFGSGIQATSSPMMITISLCLMGFALGLFQSPNNNAIMGAVHPSKLGIASAFLATVRNLAMVSGTGLATAVFSWRMSITQDFVQSLHLAFRVAGVIAVAAMIASLGKTRGRPAAPGSGSAG